MAKIIVESVGPYLYTLLKNEEKEYKHLYNDLENEVVIKNYLI